MNFFEQLLNNENDENIILRDEEGNTEEYEQLAVFPLDKDGVTSLYAVLKPVTPPDGMDELAVVIFRVDTDSAGEEATLHLETSDEIADAVFAKFEEMLAEYVLDAEDAEPEA